MPGICIKDQSPHQLSSILICWHSLLYCPPIYLFIPYRLDLTYCFLFMSHFLCRTWFLFLNNVAILPQAIFFFLSRCWILSFMQRANTWQKGDRVSTPFSISLISRWYNQMSLWTLRHCTWLSLSTDKRRFHWKEPLSLKIWGVQGHSFLGHLLKVFCLFYKNLRTMFLIIMGSF